VNGAREEPAAAPSSSAPFRVRAARAADLDRLWELTQGLATYERMQEEVTGTRDAMGEALFSAAPSAECLVLEGDRTLLGYALFFPVFSTFSTRRRMWLEDLYVDPAARGTGGGRLLMEALARLCLERGIHAVRWIVLDWNASAIDFYRRLGGRENPASNWLQYGMEEDALRALAAGPARRDRGV